jgi:hypothetical protein
VWIGRNEEGGKGLAGGNRSVRDAAGQCLKSLIPDFEIRAEVEVRENVVYRHSFLLD